LALIQEQIERDLEPERHTAEGLALEMLGILPREFPYLDCMRELYEGETAAFFRPSADDFVVPAWQPHNQGNILHELTHALQHQHFNLDSFLPPKSLTSDEFLARLALVEGDAVVTERTAQSSLPPTRVEVSSSLSPGAAGRSLQRQCKLPPLFQAFFAFPYQDGAAFVSALRSRGGVSLLNRAFTAPPRTTSEILHPDLFGTFTDSMLSTRTVLERQPGDSPTDQTLFTDRAGELGVALYLSHFVNEGVARTAAEGWRNDSLSLVQTAQQKLRLRWQISMSKPGQAKALHDLWDEAFTKLLRTDNRWDRALLLKGNQLIITVSAL
jgi:hypothetical protein